MIGLLRLLGGITIVLALLLFLFSDEATVWTTRLLILVGGIVLAAGLVVLAAVIDVAIDVEENTRSAFRVQQLILEELQERAEPPAGVT